MFDRIVETEQNSDIILKVVHKEPSFSSINNNSTDSRSKMSKRLEMVSPRHQLLRKRLKQVHDYSHKLIDDFKLVIVNLSPKLADQEKHSIATSFGSYFQDQCIKTNTKIIFTHVLKRWNANKYSEHPSKCALDPYETVAMRIYLIELKWYS